MSNTITLNETAASVRHLLASDEHLNRVIRAVGELTYSPEKDAFSFLAEVIIGQMLSNKVAEILAERFRKLCCGNVVPRTVRELNPHQLRAIGISARKADYIYRLAALAAEDHGFFEGLSALDDDTAMKQLTTLQGIGSWSAKMYLIFVLDRQDVLPLEDGAFLQAYAWLYGTSDRSAEEIKKRCACWRPYSSIAARYMYRAFDLGLTK